MRNKMFFPGCPGRRGFALIIALSLMAVLVLLALSLSALVRVESRSVANAQALAEARQNAYLGAMIGLGQVQQHTGPDQRVTATSQYVAGSSVLVEDPTGSGEDDVVRQGHWTGVWTAQASDSNPSVPVNRHLMWLVSGNESVNPDASEFQSNRGDGLVQTRLFSRPIYDNADGLANGNVWMVRRSATATSDLENASAEERANWVQVPAVEIDGNGSSYGWWAGDESVKARFNLGEAPDTAPDRARYAFRLAQVNRFTGMDLDGFPLDSNVSDRFLNLESLGFGSSDWHETARLGFHQLTGVSRGLLTDSSRGGLRYDLAAAFDDDAQFEEMVDLVGTGLGGRAIFDSADLNNDGQVTAAERTLGNPGGPLWDQLRSFSQIDPSDGSGPATTHALRPHRDDSHGLMPVVTRVQFYFYASNFFSRYRPGHVPGTVPDIEAHYFQGTRYWILPTVVLWNPYNTTIEVDAETFFRFTTRYTQRPSLPTRRSTHAAYAARLLHFSDREDAAWNGLPNGSHTGFRWIFEDGQGVPLTFRLPTFTLEPGEAKVFSPTRNSEYININTSFLADANPDANLLAENDSWHGGYGFWRDVPGLETVENVGRTAGINNQGSRNYVKVGVRHDLFKNWQWGLRPEFEPEDYLVSSHGLRWHGTDNHWRDASSRINYHFEAPWDGYPAVQHHSAWDQWGNEIERLSRDEFENIPLQARYEGQSTLFFDFPDHGFKTRMRFSQNPISMPGGTIERTQWIGQNNPRATFTGRSPWDLEVPQSTYFNPNYADRVPRDWYNQNMVHAAYPFDLDATGHAYVGNSDDAGTGNLRSILFHAPRDSGDFLSLADFSHANLTRHHDYLPAADVHQNFSEADWAQWRTFPNLFDNLQPAYPLGNSIIDPRIPSAQTFLWWPEAHANFSGIDSVQYDLSYHLNEALWDRFYLSGIPQSGPVPDTLPFNRYKVSDNATDGELRSFDTAASHLTVEGPFNLNSVSVDAWRALLRATYGYPVETLSGPVGNEAEAPFVRSLFQENLIADPGLGLNADANYLGFRRLSLAEIDALAEAIVEEYRSRRTEPGPFLSIADAINRDPLSEEVDHRTKGILQAALDRTVNAHFTQNITADDVTPYYPAENIVGSSAAGVPGYMMQSDLLARIGPALTARSDTFRIRSYGISSAAGGVNGSSQQAWAELIVQRIPDYVDNSETPETRPDELGPENEIFGRRYVVLSFRWLNEEEI